MLVNCVAYQDGKKLADIPVSEIGEYLKKQNVFVWVAYFEPSDQEIRHIQQQFGLHELAVEDARKGHQRPKIEEYGDTVFVVMKTIDCIDHCFHEGEVSVFVGKNFVVSVRQKTQNGFANVRARCENEPLLLKQGPAFVFYAIMDTVVDRYFPLIEHIDDELEKTEAKVFKGQDPRQSAETLYQLKQKVMTLKHIVGPLLEATGKLYGGRVPQVCANSQEYFRDVYDHLMRINSSIENSREMLVTAMQVNLAMISLSESEVNKKLAAYAAIIAVPTMLAGIYGMNFKYMPEIEWPYAYPVVLLIMLVIDVALYVRFKKAHWI